MSYLLFFEQAIFKEMAKTLHRRYYLKGDFGKSMGLTNFSDSEKEPLRQLLGVTPVQWTTQKTISLALFEIALSESSAHWDLTEFVSYLFGPLKLKSEEMAIEKERFTFFLKEINDINPLFQEKLSQSQLQTWFHRKDGNLIYFEQVNKALKQLPNDYLKLPVFSYNVTGNSHTFDANSPAGDLLLQVLSTLAESNQELYEQLSEVEIKNNVLKEFYLLRDDINNYVTIRGLVGFKGTKRSEMWYQACLEDCSWNVPLREVLRMDKIESLYDYPIIIVENSGIYSILLDRCPDIAMICSSGQFSLSVWLLLRKLKESNQTFLYVGDLDPDGLLIAQKLLNMFPNNSKTIGMTISNFKVAQSRVKTFDESQLKKLNTITEPVLLEVANEIKMTGNIGLQEGFLYELIKEIQEITEY
ncbi:TIGR02679 domain-containing protein [Vagococcus fluvialis]|uniref:TIGR02679 domain-containing protein n=1 Tax=Vagococcus fluvialis TaxID=2738 RepID=UPI0037D93883